MILLTQLRLSSSGNVVTSPRIRKFITPSNIRAAVSSVSIPAGSCLGSPGNKVSLFSLSSVSSAIPVVLEVVGSVNNRSLRSGYNNFPAVHDNLVTVLLLGLTSFLFSVFAAVISSSLSVIMASSIREVGLS